MSNAAPSITFQGNPLTLLGQLPAAGEAMPAAMLVGNDLSPVELASFRGKVLLISAVPSLDTGVCDIQTRKFNEAAASLGDDVQIATISMDLPFAQARWCGAAGVDQLVTLSDYRDGHAFGNGFGLLIKELQLLARAVLVVDAGGVVRYVEVVSEMTDEPNYDAALAAVAALTGS
jgi:thiol peroxidase